MHTGTSHQDAPEQMILDCADFFFLHHETLGGKGSSKSARLLAYLLNLKKNCVFNSVFSFNFKNNSNKHINTFFLKVDKCQEHQANIPTGNKNAINHPALSSTSCSLTWFCVNLFFGDSSYIIMLVPADTVTDACELHGAVFAQHRLRNKTELTHKTCASLCNSPQSYREVNDKGMRRISRLKTGVKSSQVSF